MTHFTSFNFWLRRFVPYIVVWICISYLGNAKGQTTADPTAASDNEADAIYYLAHSEKALQTNRVPFELSSATNSDKKEFVFAYVDSRPLGYVNDMGKPDGYLFNLAKAALDTVGVQHKQYLFPVGRVYATVFDGSSDMTFSASGPALNQCCLVGNQPIAFDELSVYHTADKPKISSIEDLAGKKFIKIMGYGYGGALDVLNSFKTTTRIESAPNRESALLMLLMDRADYLLDYAAPMQGALVQANISGLQRDVVKRINFYVVLSKQVPDSEKLLKTLENTIANLQKAPEFKPPIAGALRFSGKVH